MGMGVGDMGKGNVRNGDMGMRNGKSAQTGLDCGIPTHPPPSPLWIICEPSGFNCVRNT